MRNGKQLLLHVVVVASLALAALPTAQAGGADDRPYYRGATPASTSPDDRPYYRGGSDTLAPASLSPDDRAFARSVGGDERAVAPRAVRTTSGFDWDDALIGATFGLALASLGTGALLVGVGRHRRRDLRSA